MASNVVGLPTDHEFILSVLWTLSRAPLFLFSEEKPECKDATHPVGALLKYLKSKTLGDDFELLKFYCSVCKEIKQTALVYE